MTGRDADVDGANLSAFCAAISILEQRYTTVNVFSDSLNFSITPFVISVRFDDRAVVIETANPDAFYTRLTAMAASGEAGAIEEVASPDDNLHAVFKYLVKP